MTEPNNQKPINTPSEPTPIITPTPEPIITPKPATPTALPIVPDSEGLAKAKELIAKIQAKEKSIEDREKALDAKIAEIDQSMIGGQSISQQPLTENQKNENEANKLMEGTGFSFVDEPYDAFAQKKPSKKN